MNWLLGVWPWLFSLGVLILLSAFFSGSEAALFSLNRPNRRRLARSGPGGRIADGLLKDPDRLLSAILFWNLLINMAYFAIAAILGSKLEADPSMGRSAAVAFTAVSLLAIIFFSEMLPKSFAVLVPVRLSATIGRPLLLTVQLVSPVLPLVNATNRVAKRLLWPNFEPEADLDLNDIDRAIDLWTGDADLQPRDRRALHGLVEMAEMRAAELMRPRSKLILVPQPIERRVVLDQIPAGGYLLITDHALKNVTGAIGIRHLRPSQMDDLESAREDVLHVPWSARVSQVWNQLKIEDVSVAVVVNEFGEVVGALTADAILRRILSARRGVDEESQSGDTIQVIGDDRYRVFGSASLRRFAKRLDIDLPDQSIATVAGFIQRQNERLPRVGDSARLDRFELTVVQQQNEETWIEVVPARDEDDVEGDEK